LGRIFGGDRIPPPPPPNGGSNANGMRGDRPGGGQDHGGAGGEDSRGVNPPPCVMESLPGANSFTVRPGGEVRAGGPETRNTETRWGAVFGFGTYGADRSTNLKFTGGQKTNFPGGALWAGGAGFVGFVHKCPGGGRAVKGEQNLR